MSDKMREAFEAWGRSEGWLASFAKATDSDPDGWEYSEQGVEMAWRGYQAAWAASAMACADACVEPIGAWAGEMTGTDCAAACSRIARGE